MSVSVGDTIEIDYDYTDESGAVSESRRGFRVVVGGGEIDSEFEKSILNGNIHKIFQNVRMTKIKSENFLNQIESLKASGNAEVKIGNYLNAYNYYSNGIELLELFELNENNTKFKISLLSNKSLTCIKLGLFTECIAVCDEVLQLDPKNSKCRFRRGVAEFELGLIGRSKKDLLLAQSLEPTDSVISDLLESIRREEEKIFNKNSKAFDEIIEIKINNFKIKIQLFSKITPIFVEIFRTCLSAGFGVNRIFKNDLIKFSNKTEIDKFDSEILNRKFIHDENLNTAHWKPGILGMSNYGPNTNTGDFYITLREAPELDYKHVVFGEVLEGLDELISWAEACETDECGIPSDDVVVNRIH
jgi:cyclophilin family peptidyl-prolyl cis-trans isomerase